MGKRVFVGGRWVTLGESPSGKRKRKKVKVNWLALAAIIGAVVVVGAVIKTAIYFTITKPDAEFVGDTPCHDGYKRRWNQAPPTVDASAIFTPKKRRELIEGEGYCVPFTITYPGKLQVTKRFTVPALKSRSEKTPQEREKELNRLIGAEFPQFVHDEFLTSHPINRRVAVIVDVTEGMPTWLQRQIRGVYADLNVPLFLKSGTLRLDGYRLSASSFLQSKRSPGRSKDANDFGAVREWLLEDPNDHRESSVVLGLSNIFGELFTASDEETSPTSVQLPWEIHILSDGAENSATTGISLYKDKSLLSDSRQNELAQLLDKAVKDGKAWPKQVPDGTTVHWHLPRQEAIKGIRVATLGKFWTGYLQSRMKGLSAEYHHGQ